MPTEKEENKKNLTEILKKLESDRDDIISLSYRKKDQKKLNDLISLFKDVKLPHYRVYYPFINKLYPINKMGKQFDDTFKTKYVINDIGYLIGSINSKIEKLIKESEN